MIYKPGNKVICIEDFESIFLIKGKIYIVSYVNIAYSNLISVVGGVIPYSKSRFIPENASRLEKLICGYKNE